MDGSVHDGGVIDHDLRANSGAAGDSEMSDPHEEWRCPTCGSRSDEHTVERDGPESLDVVVCRRCGTKWPPRPAAERPATK